MPDRSNSSRAGEFDLIARHFAPLSASALGALNLTDDAALCAPREGFEFAITTDAVVAGVHFLADDAPETVAGRLTGCNLSDLAAMGAVPYGFTLACAWPRDMEEAWIAAFAAELGRWVERFSFPLLGGDTVSTAGPAMFSLTALGEVERGKALKRSGAKVGERLFVTCTVGDGLLGLRAAEGKAQALPATARNYLLDRFRAPRPRIQAGRALIGKAGACIDTSDGLVQDVGHIAETSGVGIEIDAAAVPLSAAARDALAAGVATLEELLAGGDDYELAFTSSAEIAALGETAHAGNVDMTVIGRVVEGAGVRVLDAAGNEMKLAKGGYSHF